MNKPAVTQAPIHELLARRWSPRAFDVSRPVSRDQLLSIMEAARWAPSCYGDEPWRYIVWDRNDDPVAWQKAFDCLGEFNQQWVKNTPVLMLALASTHFRKGTPNRHGQYDTGAASENICLQATALGLMAHQMGGFDATMIAEVFSIPDELICMAMIAVGYQAEPDVLEGTLKESEVAERTRRPLGENVFSGGWGVPIVKA
jgi:nitroreductase